MRIIRLSKTDLTYLMNTRFLPEDLERMINAVQISSRDEERLLKLDQYTADRFRDEFTTRLAQVGFGPDYEPTREGKLLEDLIDRFMN